MTRPTRVDWIKAKRFYNAGIIPIQAIAEKLGCTKQAIYRKVKENGWTQPIVAKKKPGGRGLIAAGHGRHLAALMLFREGDLSYEKIPVVWVPWDDDKLRAYVILDNKLGDESTWDKVGLKAFMEGIMEKDGDTFTGFNAAEIEALMSIGESPDDFPEIGSDLEIQHQCPKCGYEWSGKAKQ